MDKKIKPWTLRFPAKENPNMEKSLFDWPIVLQYDVKAKYRLISRKFSGMKFFSKATRVCIRSISQSNRSISVRLLFLFSCAFSFQGQTKIALFTLKKYGNVHTNPDIWIRVNGALNKRREHFKRDCGFGERIHFTGFV